jgi:hypothetical protein
LHFQHVSNDIVNVNLAGQSQPLEVTAGHLLWSLDRDGWVAAGNLSEGERLAGEDGPVVVESVTTDAVSQAVYNLDVETDHRYLVTGEGIVAHNVSPNCVTGTQFQQNTVSELERLEPGIVLKENVPVNDANGASITDYDIVTKQAVIECKSGPFNDPVMAEKVFLQASVQAVTTSKPIVIYAPDMNPTLVARLTSAGRLVATNMNDLFALVKN